MLPLDLFFFIIFFLQFFNKMFNDETNSDLKKSSSFAKIVQDEENEDLVNYKSRKLIGIKKLYEKLVNCFNYRTKLYDSAVSSFILFQLVVINLKASTTSTVQILDKTMFRLYWVSLALT